LQYLADPSEAANWLASEKILIHPTEGVWGLGCLYNSKKGMQRLSALKLRSSSKNYIILSPNIEWVTKLSVDLNEDDLNQYWPGHTTLLLRPSKLCPIELISDMERIAIRVSAHKPIQMLLNILQKPILSTSANISGKEQINDIEAIQEIFDFDDVALYTEQLGNKMKPSKIIDYVTGKVIRA
jgi:L-threonylcarbamoyladenylate synthase